MQAAVYALPCGKSLKIINSEIGIIFPALEK
jgi:hypothetical protein